MIVKRMWQELGEVIPSPSCPACDQKNWECIGEKQFDRLPVPEDSFRALRYRVLFEVWQPDAVALKVKFVLCLSCGFVGYTPRATVDEVEAKYRFIALHDPAKRASAEVSDLDRRRSRHLLSFVHRFIQRGSVLDFGGGNGALLDSFVKAGFECDVVDFVPVTVSGVRRLGESLDDIPPGQKFMLIVASHVFEHLADPVQVGRKLREYLDPSGVLMVEVPLEILGGPPLMREPVTHVNFFCRSSLEVVLQRAGFVVATSKVMAVLTEHGSVRYAVRAIARPMVASSETVPILPGAREARGLLNSRTAARLLRDLGSPLVLLSRAQRLVGRRPFSRTTHV